MTIARGNFGLLNLTLLLAAGIGGALFVHAEMHTPAPLIGLSIRNAHHVCGGERTGGLLS